MLSKGLAVACRAIAILWGIAPSAWWASGLYVEQMACCRLQSDCDFMGYNPRQLGGLADFMLSKGFAVAADRAIITLGLRPYVNTGVLS